MNNSIKLIVTITKTCCTCKLEKPLFDFNNDQKLKIKSKADTGHVRRNITIPLKKRKNL